MELCRAIHTTNNTNTVSDQEKDATDDDDDFGFFVPVVVGLTADTCLDVMEKCISSGMVDVIHKPITVEGLKDFFDKRITTYISQNEQQHQHQQSQSQHQQQSQSQHHHHIETLFGESNKRKYNDVFGEGKKRRCKDV